MTPRNRPRTLLGSIIAAVLSGSGMDNTNNGIRIPKGTKAASGKGKSTSMGANNGIRIPKGTKERNREERFKRQAAERMAALASYIPPNRANQRQKRKAWRIAPDSRPARNRR